MGAVPNGEVHHVPALLFRGEVDIVGSDGAVNANLTAALAVGTSLRESRELAMVVSSSVIHQLGTTGTATVIQLQRHV